MNYDVVLIGGGIVGLATAYQLTERYPRLSLVVLEKEDRLATHQTGRNSGVLHSGIYYKPGSLKARYCREGRSQMVTFCEREGVAYETCGKVIVAVAEAERPRLQALYERGLQNGIRCERIGPERLREREPYVAGVEAVYVADAGIVDFAGVTRRLAEIIEARGQIVMTQTEVIGLQSGDGRVVLETTQGAMEGRYVVNCTGLFADRIARLSGQDPGVRIIPFRGEYFVLKPSARHLCRHLIYPVPDPAFPFLGVHFTRMIDGRVECGPNAVLALAREGYTFGTLVLRDLAEILAYRGFRRLARLHWKTALNEQRRSFSKRHYLRALRRLIPAVTPDDLEPRPPGVRAQTVRPDGTLSDDFLVLGTERVVNVVNAPSPAATAALHVGRHVVDALATRF